MRRITEAIKAEHARIVALFTRARERAPGGGGAPMLFERFRSSLEGHIQWEEKMLFPLYEKGTGMLDYGPSASLRFQHRQIEDLLGDIGEKIRSGNEGCADTEETLGIVLASHNMKEETILCPWIDAHVSREERAAVLGRKGAAGASRRTGK